MTAVWAWVVLFFAEDLTYYWFHRIAHERRFWWASHVNHHTSTHYNLSTALRQTWTGGVAGTWLLWLPLSFLGFPPAMVAIQKGISLVYQFWIHTEAIKRMPRWFEAVFNTPSHHRVHHARNARYLDANYAGILIIWDRMFGTFIPETDEEPCRYGTVKNLASFNLFTNVFHEWIGIGKDLAGRARRATPWATCSARPAGARRLARHLAHAEGQVAGADGPLAAQPAGRRPGRAGRPAAQDVVGPVDAQEHPAEAHDGGRGRARGQAVGPQRRALGALGEQDAQRQEGGGRQQGVAAGKALVDRLGGAVLGRRPAALEQVLQPLAQHQGAGEHARRQQGFATLAGDGQPAGRDGRQARPVR
jgi:hypothetical protein